jgi:hypothetical protein
MNYQHNPSAGVYNGRIFSVLEGSELRRRCIWVQSANIYGVEESRYSILYIGFDSEFKSLDYELVEQALQNGTALNTVLSYQVWCRIYDPIQPGAPEWGGVVVPSLAGDRLSLSDVLSFALSTYLLPSGVKIPRRMCITGHFTRADISSFDDASDLWGDIDTVRNTFVTLKKPFEVEIDTDAGVVPLQVSLRDTSLLSATDRKSLAALGELVGVPKIVLDQDPTKELFYKQNMDVLLQQHPALFGRYALTDAKIAVRYIDHILDVCSTSKSSGVLPVSIPSIGVNRLLEDWKSRGIDRHAVLGKVKHTELEWDPRKKRKVKVSTAVNLPLVQFHYQLAVDSYHGGRNEQYWFGPSPVDNWSDYDLAGAYPTAMSLIREPDWENVRVSSRASDYGIDTLGCAYVEFSFPKTIRLPTLPVRTPHGQIYPRRGFSHCCASKIYLARKLGAKVKILHGVIVPWASDKPVFAEFIKQCAIERGRHTKGTLPELFHKELANSLYGKVAQGLHGRRVYDMKARKSRPLPPSKITNPYFAGYITAFVRACLGEVLNSLPEGLNVFSVTTDGFLTNASRCDIDAALTGPFAQLYATTRTLLVGNDTVLERKHACRQLLGVRTRGQATLLPGDDEKGDDFNYVIAKAGIHLPGAYSTVRSQNDHFVDLFMTRTRESKIIVTSLLSVRNIVERGCDLVQKQTPVSLGMEYDWKRRPVAGGTSADHNHLYFSTRPWENVEKFHSIREVCDKLNAKGKFCLKTISDFERFSTYLLVQTSVGPQGLATYIRSDVKRLRQLLCSAWYQSQAGLKLRQDGLNNRQFAEVLTSCGIECTAENVENGKRRDFAPCSCPATPSVMKALSKLKRKLPTLDANQFVADSTGAIDLTNALKR